MISTFFKETNWSSQIGTPKINITNNRFGWKPPFETIDCVWLSDGQWENLHHGGGRGVRFEGHHRSNPRGIWVLHFPCLLSKCLFVLQNKKKRIVFKSLHTLFLFGYFASSLVPVLTAFVPSLLTTMAYCFLLFGCRSWSWCVTVCVLRVSSIEFYLLDII